MSPTQIAAQPTLMKPSLPWKSSTLPLRYGVHARPARVPRCQQIAHGRAYRPPTVAPHGDLPSVAVAILGPSEPVLLPLQEDTPLRGLLRSAQERLSTFLAGSGAPLPKQSHVLTPSFPVSIVSSQQQHEKKEMSS
jgi:hypothetical protein